MDAETQINNLDKTSVNGCVNSRPATQSSIQCLKHFQCWGNHICSWGCSHSIWIFWWLAVSNIEPKICLQGLKVLLLGPCRINLVPVAHDGPSNTWKMQACSLSYLSSSLNLQFLKPHFSTWLLNHFLSQSLFQNNLYFVIPNPWSPIYCHSFSSSLF